MNYLLLELVLGLSSLNCEFPNVCETIRISDDLVIDSLYKPAGSVLEDEYMLLRIEDFSIVQSEVESSAAACGARLDSLKKIHLAELKSSQAKCEERASVYISELAEAKKDVEHLNSSLKKESHLRRVHAWVNAALLLSSVTLATIILIDKK